MHHLLIEHWSRGRSFLHRRDPRAKAVALLTFLVLIATSQTVPLFLGLIYFGFLVVAILVARLPVWSVLSRAAVVLPFTLAFALISFLTGEPLHGLTLLEKSYVSALAVLVLVATTPLPQFLRGLELMGVPRFLLMVTQFLYRYLFVIAEEAQNMRIAGLSRGGSVFRAAAGALAVLFARSYARADNIHRSMLARGFQGRFHLLSVLHFGWSDAVFLLIATFVPAVIRLMLERCSL